MELWTLGTEKNLCNICKYANSVLAEYFIAIKLFRISVEILLPASSVMVDTKQFEAFPLKFHINPIFAPLSNLIVSSKIWPIFTRIKGHLPSNDFLIFSQPNFIFNPQNLFIKRATLPHHLPPSPCSCLLYLLLTTTWDHLQWWCAEP